MRLNLFVFFILAISLNLIAQQESKMEVSDSLKAAPYKPDSIRMNRFLMMQDFAIFSPSPGFRAKADFSNASGFKSFLGRDMRMSSDFLSPLYSKYLNDQKMAPYMYILGIAQGAAAGYLLYEHIREYGVWDNKKKK